MTAAINLLKKCPATAGLVTRMTEKSWAKKCEKTRNERLSGNGDFLHAYCRSCMGDTIPAEVEFINLEQIKKEEAKKVASEVVKEKKKCPECGTMVSAINQSGGIYMCGSCRVIHAKIKSDPLRVVKALQAVYSQKELSEMFVFEFKDEKAAKEKIVLQRQISDFEYKYDKLSEAIELKNKEIARYVDNIATLRAELEKAEESEAQWTHLDPSFENCANNSIESELESITEQNHNLQQTIDTYQERNSKLREILWSIIMARIATPEKVRVPINLIEQVKGGIDLIEGRVQ